MAMQSLADACLRPLACDFRIMVAGKANISLNEITFGSSVFAGSVAMLKFLVGGRDAQAILYNGAMYSAQAASQLGMIDQISSDEKLVEEARKVARCFADKDEAAFRSMKGLFRAQVAGRSSNLYRSLLTSGTPTIPGTISKQ